HTVTVTVTDNDPFTPQLTPSAQTAAEGTAAQFTLALGKTPTQPREFTLAVTGTGVTAADYAAPASVTFAPGAATATFGIDILYDGTAEAEETLTVTATGAADPSLRAAAVVTVPQNAAAVRAVTVTGPATVAEGAAAAGTAAEFEAELDMAFTVDTAAAWRIAHGDTADADFIADSGDFTFTAGQTTATFTVRIAPDGFNEGTETFSVRVGAADSAAAGGTAPGEAASEITDAADDAVRVTIVPGADIAGPGLVSGEADSVPMVTEGGSATFRLIAGGGSRTADLRISFSVETTAAYTANPAGELVIGVDESSGEIVLTFTDDDVSQGTRPATLTATASTAGAASVSGMGELRVADDDSVTVTAGATDTDLLEGETGVVTLTLDRASGGDLVLPWVITAGGDHPPPGGVGGSSPIAGEGTPPATSGRLTIPAGQTSGQLDVRSLLTSTINSGTGTLTVDFSGVEVGEGGGLAVVGGTGRVVFTVAFYMARRDFRVMPPADAALTEGESAVFTVALSRAPDQGSPASVQWAVEGIAAADLTGDTSGALTFTHANAAPQAFTVATVDNNLNEPGRTLTVRLSGATGGGPNGAAVDAQAASASVTVADNDAITARISGPATANEGDRGVTFTVTLSGGILAGPVTAQVRPGGGAGAGDFTLTADRVTGAGVATVNIAVPNPASTTAAATFTAAFTRDGLNEADEGLTLTLVSAAYGTGVEGGVLAITDGAGASQTVTITDADPIFVFFGDRDRAGAENDTVTIDVRLSGAVPSAEVVVPYHIAGAGITAADYHAPEAVVRFPAGADFSTIARIRIHIRPDGVAEPAERMVVSLRADRPPLSAGEVRLSTLRSQRRAEIVIAESAAVAHHFALEGDATVAEGAVATYTVTRTGANGGAPPPITAGETLSVAWTYSSSGAGSASAADFTGGVAPAGGSLTFTAFDARRTFTVNIADDADNEAAEDFTLDLSLADLTVEGGLGLGAPLTVTIAANDGITVTPSGGSAVSEGDSAEVQLDFGVALLAPLTVEYAIAGVSGAGAADADDWSDSGGGRAVFDVGATDGSIQVGIVDDDLNEGAEAFTVTVTAASTVGPASVHAASAAQSFVIMASDSLAATIAADDAVRIAGEGETVSLTVQLDRASAAPVTVLYGVSAAAGDVGPAPTVVDHTGGAVTIPAGQTRGEIRVASAPVAARVGSGAITVTLQTATAPGAASASGAAVITVNYRAARILSIADAHASAAEGDGLAFIVSHAGAAGQDAELSVRWAVTPAAESGRAAVEPADFCDAAGDPLTDTPGGVLTFALGDTEETIIVRLCDDTSNEGAEYYDLTLSEPAPPAAAELSPTAARLASRAIDASDPLTLSVARTAPAAGAVHEGGSQTFTFTAAGGALAGGAAVAYTIGGGSGDTADAHDWSVASSGGAFALTPGRASSDFTLSLTDDELNEGAETVTVAFQSALGHDAGVIDFTATEFALTIAANDPATVSVANAGADLDAGTAGFQTAEGHDARFTVALSRASAADVTVPFTVGGDVAAADYTAPNALQVEIPAGDLSALLSLPLLLDGAAEAAETLRVTLAVPISVAAGGGAVSLSAMPTDLSAEVSIAASATERHSLVFSRPVARRIDEGATTSFTVTRNGPALADGELIEVLWNAGTRGASNPAAAADFSGGTLPGGRLVFTASSGDARAFTVATASDNLNEAAETFFLELKVRSSVAQAHGGIGIGERATVIITDDDAVRVDPVLSAPRNLNEGETVRVVISLAGAPRSADVILRPRIVGVGGAPVSAADFSNLRETIVLGPQVNNLRAVDVVTVTVDQIAEAQESFEVHFTAESAGEVTFPFGTGAGPYHINAAPVSTAAFTGVG
ncbi:MAG: hypothetical protein OXU22_06645, partial [Gammaproteobacteria bacterium]|nr:hypothetical protein [Gammaproteobacteria bacterium]